ncbi:MAG: phosphoglycerate mutase family protein [Bdellovibrionales bacterium]|nr:phosphoglycerate mutase family protein [Bdellovibrionales bacterium]
MSKKKLVLIRHAHRKVPKDRTEDNGLSKKGQRQVEKLLSYWSSGNKARRVSFLSSPKKRCVETLEPLAEIFGEKLSIEPLLDEQSEKGESNKDFSGRVNAFLESSKFAKAEVLFVCSHADWIPAAYDQLKHKSVRVRKGTWVELEL